jgi:transposase
MKNKRWKPSEETKLMQMHRAGYSYEQIAKELDRTTASVTVRLSVIRKRHGELTRVPSKEAVSNSLAFPLLCTVFAVLMVYIWGGN